MLFRCCTHCCSPGHNTSRWKDLRKDLRRQAARETVIFFFCCCGAGAVASSKPITAVSPRAGTKVLSEHHTIAMSYHSVSFLALAVNSNCLRVGSYFSVVVVVLVATFFDFAAKSLSVMSEIRRQSPFFSPGVENLPSEYHTTSGSSLTLVVNTNGIGYGIRRE